MEAIERGKFITLEGIDGAGKTTHLHRMHDFLKKKGLPVLMTYEPGGTLFGQSIRSILLEGKAQVITELLLLFASRNEHIHQVIEPALSSGVWVLSDRFTDSSYAYQGGGAGIPKEIIQNLEKIVHSSLEPDLTFYFDIDLHTQEKRLSQRTQDVFETRGVAFFNRVLEAYWDRIRDYPNRFYLLKADRDMMEIWQDIEAIFLRKLFDWDIVS